jgi:ABC-type sugar transport system ATPase subunit
VTVKLEAFESSFPATVQVVEPLGNETLLYFNLAGDQFVVRAPGKVGVDVDQQAHLALPHQYLHFFSAEDGQSLLR